MNKNVLVTGGTRGIGEAISREFAKKGYDLIINYVNSNEKAQNLKQELEKEYNIKVLPIQADISNEIAIKNMVDTAIKEFGKIDVLVNNAGITRDGLLMKMSEEDFDAVVDTNLKGAFNCIRFASRQMLKQRSGRIISLSSVVGVYGNAGQANYAASKAGIIGLTKACAKELASRHITVNAIAPGFIETEMTEVLSEKVKETAKAQIPFGTFGQPEDIAKTAAFLASDDARYITGQVICVDGGM